MLAVSVFAWYLSLCLCPDLSKASWYGVTESLKISSEEDNDESQDSIESRSCLMIDGGWLESVFMYYICNKYIFIHYRFVLCICRKIFFISVLEKILYSCIIYVLSFCLGNVEEALKKIQRFVCSKSAFLQAFIEKGLKFTSSLYVMLIWIRVLKFVFENPKKVNKQVVNVPFFNKFQKVPTTENYKDGLVRSISSLKIAATLETPRVKQRLFDLEDSEYEDEEPIPKKKKKSKRAKAAAE